MTTMSSIGNELQRPRQIYFDILLKIQSTTFSNDLTISFKRRFLEQFNEKNKNSIL